MTELFARRALRKTTLPFLYTRLVDPRYRGFTQGGYNGSVLCLSSRYSSPGSILEAYASNWLRYSRRREATSSFKLPTEQNRFRFSCGPSWLSLTLLCHLLWWSAAFLPPYSLGRPGNSAAERPVPSSRLAPLPVSANDENSTAHTAKRTTTSIGDLVAPEVGLHIFSRLPAVPL